MAKIAVPSVIALALLGFLTTLVGGARVKFPLVDFQKQYAAQFGEDANSQDAVEELSQHLLKLADHFAKPQPKFYSEEEVQRRLEEIRKMPEEEIAKKLKEVDEEREALDKRVREMESLLAFQKKRGITPESLKPHEMEAFRLAIQKRKAALALQECAACGA